MELLMNVYSGAVAVALMNLCFEPRFSGAASWGLSLLGAAAYTGAVSLLNWITPFEGLAAVGYALLMFLYGAAARKGRALDKLVLGLMWDNLLILASLGVMLAWPLSGWEPLAWAAGEGGRGLALGASALLRLAAAAGLVRLFRGLRFRDRRFVWIMALYFFAGAWGAEMAFETLWSGRWQKGLPFYFLLLMVMTLVLFFYLWAGGEWRRKQWRKEYEGQFLKEQQERLGRLGGLNRRLDGFCHDMQGQLATVYLLIQAGEESRAGEYVRKLSGQLSGICLKEEGEDGFSERSG